MGGGGEWKRIVSKEVKSLFASNVHRTVFPVMKKEKMGGMHPS